MVNPKCSKWFTNNTLMKLSFRRAKKPAVENKKDVFQEIFRRLDLDGDGRISRDELRSFLGWTGDHALPEEADVVVDNLDVDRDGFIDYRSFVQLVRRVGVEGEEDNGEDIRRAFEMYEGEEGEGCITPKGLQRVFGRLGEEKTLEECYAMIRVYDLDDDGVLDYHEFYKMMS